MSRAHVWRLTCDRCHFDCESYDAQNWKDFQSDRRNDGWVVSSSPSDDYCPECAQQPKED